MGHSTEHTIWPYISPAKETKDLLDSLLSSMDSDETSVGDTLADNIFAPNGVIKSAHGIFEGSKGKSLHRTITGSARRHIIRCGRDSRCWYTAEIRRCRDQAWNLVTHRRHEVKRVYVHDSQVFDLLLIGSLEMLLKNGKHIRSEFTGRVLFTEIETKSLRILLYQVWAVRDQQYSNITSLTFFFRILPL